MPDKVFYSWQSDRPNKTNRRFIEDALALAIQNLGRERNEIYAPSRDLDLDKDTKGIPGSPPVADTIFRKIEECAVFVPDLTFCGLTERERPIPNANVLIEYGWALAKLGHERIVAVMNEAYGPSTETSLPFNIRHNRWPHRFTLTEDARADERNTVKTYTDQTLRRCNPDCTCGLASGRLLLRSAATEFRHIELSQRGRCLGGPASRPGPPGADAGRMERWAASLPESRSRQSSRALQRPSDPRNA